MEDSKNYPEWSWHKETVIYKDDKYILGQKNDSAYLMIKDNRYILSCQPYEPCLYITDEKGSMTAVHNAFDPFVVFESLYKGKTVTSITGFEYNAKDFCRMVEYAAKLGNININDAEKVFGERKRKAEICFKKKDNKTTETENVFVCPKGVAVMEDDLFYEMLNEYPDCVIDYCIVKNITLYKGIDSHWKALLASALHIVADDWELDFKKGKIGAKSVEVNELFNLSDPSGKKLTYKKAFLYPPYPCGYNENDFNRLNTALFPNGMDNLEIYEWTTDWSDYFDDGNEWWGTLCLTVYDKTLERFAVIMASATD